MDAQWRVEVLITQPHPLQRSSPIVAINPQLPQRSGVTSSPSLPRLPRHSVHTHVRAHTHTYTHPYTHPHTHKHCMAGAEGRSCCDGSELAMREEPIVCFYLREKMHGQQTECKSQKVNQAQTLDLPCLLKSACEYATHPREDFLFSFFPSVHSMFSAHEGMK